MILSENQKIPVKPLYNQLDGDKKFQIFSYFLKKTIDKHVKTWYNIITETKKGVITLNKKIKELIEIAKQIDKLLTQILKVLITISTIWAVIKGTFF